MKLYIAKTDAPNPRRVLMFLKEKKLDVPLERVDLGARAHRSAP